MHWIDALKTLQHSGEAHMLVSIISVQGSTPRDTDSKMVVSGQRCYDSIGGGHLEHRATLMARERLLAQRRDKHIETFTLSTQLGQCCGGQVTLLFEPFIDTRRALTLFGAGHVAQALVRILADLPWRVTWVDSRDEWVPVDTPSNVQFCHSDPVTREIALAPAHSDFLVMTHHHGLDLDLCEAILKRDDGPWCGLIGSQAKAKRFRQRLQQRGVSPLQLEGLCCPVGLEAISGKRPMEVAVSIAAQLIQRQSDSSASEGLSLSAVQPHVTEPRS